MDPEMEMGMVTKKIDHGFGMESSGIVQISRNNLLGLGFLTGRWTGIDKREPIRPCYYLSMGRMRSSPI